MRVKNGEKRGRERAGRNCALATVELPAFFLVGESLAARLKCSVG